MVWTTSDLEWVELGKRIMKSLNATAEELATLVLRTSRNKSTIDAARAVLASLERRRAVGSKSGKLGGRPKTWSAYVDPDGIHTINPKGELEATFGIRASGRLFRVSGSKSKVAANVARRWAKFSRLQFPGT